MRTCSCTGSLVGFALRASDLFLCNSPQLLQEFLPLFGDLYVLPNLLSKIASALDIRILKRLGPASELAGDTLCLRFQI
jgi:hypothetical protein